MIAHLVLFEPRADLGTEDRRAIQQTLARALAEIRVVRRFTLGERVRIGAAYETSMPPFSFLALFEFEDEAALREYLAHPAHEELGRQFHTYGSAALAFDFATWSDERATQALARILESR